MRMIHPEAEIHPKAHVEGAHVGARTKVWQFASVIRRARLGEDCVVASGATLDGCRFGDRCIVCQNVAAGPGFLIGNDVFIGPNVTLCNDIWPRAHKEFFDIRELRNGGIAIIIESDVSIGANSVILPGVIIGMGSMIAAGSVVSKTIPDNSVWTRDGKVFPITDEHKRIRQRMRFASHHMPAVGAERALP